MTAAQNSKAQEIGERIVAARKRKGMSQVKLAEAMAARSGLDPESVRRSLGNNERGKFAPRLRTIQVIAEITEQPLDWFLGNVDDAPFRDAA